MARIKKKERDLFLTVIVLLWALTFSLFALGLVFRSYAPIPASAEMAGIVLGWAMVLLIIASILVCLYIVRLFYRA